MKPADAHPLLTEEEYKKILDFLGREPNKTEIAMFSVMWSEHCSYKSSKVHLKRFPTGGDGVIEGPGENAGIVDIGNGFVAAFKIESHNHPSFIEPYQGAATGVGGILRDIFTMGARPVALLNSLRFGPLDHPKNRYLMEQVVSGIAGYGNCIGVPTVGGEIYFGDTYTKNPLVNVFCLGIARREDIVKGMAAGVGNPVIYVGAKTGRDGIHGATMASVGLDQSQEARPAVQVGDPFTEKLVLEACLELIQTGSVVGMQDMGAAGLTCATSEMGDRGKVGIAIDLARVPLRESGMIPNEIMISESQERMLIVVTKGREKEAEAIFKKWNLEFSIIGEVTEGDRLVVSYHGEVVANVPVAALTSNAPVYERPFSPPVFQDFITTLNLDAIPQPKSYEEALLTLLKSPSFCSKKWVYQQYDHMVQTNTVSGPGHGAAVLRMKETDTLLAITVDGNSVYTLLNPYYGGACAVAEAARNLVCVGARPIGMTNGLNFGNPEKPEVLWALALAIEGMSDACRALHIPVVSGNVSLYNETNGLAIYPTPIVGMVGIIDSPSLQITPIFKAEDEIVLLIGETREELGGSAYLKEVQSQERGSPPLLQFEREAQTQKLLLEANRQGLISSAHDLSEGGLAVALAELCLFSKMGVSVVIETPKIRLDAVLFSESPSRVLVTVSRERFYKLKELLEEFDLPHTDLGRTGGDRLTVQIDKRTVIHLPLGKMESVYSQGLDRYFQGI
jgi:phosphoribosylformylglycinamidine synthase